MLSSPFARPNASASRLSSACRPDASIGQPSCPEPTRAGCIAVGGVTDSSTIRRAEIAVTAELRKPNRDARAGAAADGEAVAGVGAVGARRSEPWWHPPAPTADAAITEIQ